MVGIGQSKPNIREMEIKCDIEGLIKALESEDVYIKRNAVQALGKMRSEKAINALNNALNDNDGLVKIHAQNALDVISKINPESSKTNKFNFSNNDLKPVNSNVRFQAVEAPGNIRDKRAVEPIYQHWSARGSYSAQSAIKKIKNKKISEENSSNSNLKSNSKGWWSRQTKNNKIGIGFLSCILGIVLIVGVFGTLSIPPVQNDTNLSTYTPTQSNNTAVNPTNSTVSSGPLTEEEYKEWVKNDYNTWYTKGNSSSDMYNLYLQANSIIPPAKYQEFHEHYVKSYYYYYEMMQAEENGDDASFNYYNGLETEEESEYADLAQKLQIPLD